MSLDSAVRKVAQKVIAATGGLVTIRYIGAATYNTTTRTVSPTENNVSTTPDGRPLRGRVSEYTTRELSNTVRASDRKLQIAAADLAVAPTEKDRAVLANLVYEIVRVSAPQASDSAALYVLQLRR